MLMASFFAILIFNCYHSTLLNRYCYRFFTQCKYLLGAKCFGSDIDPRVLRGQMYAGSADRSLDSTKRDIFENFKSYNLEKPELIRMDNHLLDRHIQLKANSSRTASSSDRDNENSGANSNEPRSNSSSSSTRREDDVLDGMFDVIVTDPPYGIRAGAKKSGTADVRAALYNVQCLSFPPLQLITISCVNNDYECFQGRESKSRTQCRLTGGRTTSPALSTTPWKKSCWTCCTPLQGLLCGE
jgi:hypothetical protein